MNYVVVDKESREPVRGEDGVLVLGKKADAEMEAEQRAEFGTEYEAVPIHVSLSEQINPYVAEKGSDKGQAAIHETDSTHTSLIWEDGEINVTKNGELFGRRTFHLTSHGFLDGHLWEVPENKKHKYMIVIDDKATEIVREYK